MPNTVTILGTDVMEITPDPAASNSSELIPKRHVVSVIPLPYIVRDPGDTEWTYPYNSMTILMFTLVHGRRVFLELQTVSNQPGWNTGSFSGLENAQSDVEDWLSGGTLAPGPSVNTNLSTINFADVTINEIGVAMPLDVSGTNLTNNITVTAPAGYILNLDGSTVDAGPLVLPHVLGTVAPTTVYLRLAPTALAVYNDTLTVASVGATTRNVNLVGKAATPTITVSLNTLNFPNTTTNQMSASQTYDVSATGLDTDLVITAPAGWIINLDGSMVDASPISLPHVAGVVNSTIIYARFAPTSPNLYSGNITNASTGAVTKNVAVDGEAPVPVITVNPVTLSFADTEQSSYSAAQAYSVSGTDLYSNTTITAPTGFIINLDGSNTNASPIVLPHTSGVLAATIIYVKFSPPLIQAYSDNITNAATGAVTKNVSVDGLGKFAQNKLYSYYHYI